MRIKTAVFPVVAAALLAARAAAAVAQAPDPGKYSSAIHEVVEVRGQKVAMRDGIRLSVDIYRPDAAGPFPAILSITPYDNVGSRESGRWWARRGYVMVVADDRGRFDSEGEWDPFGAKHKSDGYDLVEWIAKQPWSSGPVGMVGGSYGGWTQWWTASAAPPSLKAIVPQVAPPDAFENIPYQNGVLSGWLLDWAAGMSGRTAQTVDQGPYNGWTRRRVRDLMHTPYIEINRVRGMLDSPWFETWFRANLSTHEYWQAIAYQGRENYAKITVPALNISGWFDVNHPGTPMNYVGMRDYGATPEARRPRLIIGPWIHGVNRRVVGGVDFGPEAVIDLEGYKVRWFDRFLKGIDNGVEKDPPVYLFVMGPNRWYGEKDWPLPQTQWTKYHLDSKGHANSLKGDGVLATAVPSREGFDTYVYDPAHPTRDPFSDFPNHNGHIDGPVDARISEIGDDVLVYSTPPLGEEVEVTGPIEAKLYAATSARDTDWMVRLVDVRPDGYAALLTEGVLRARSRDPENEGRFRSDRLSTIEPNRVYEYTIRFWKGTGNVFQKGHRIRIEISSSYYPIYLRNLNTGADNLALVTESEAVVATQKIYHGGKYPSHIVLPVIPRSTTAAGSGR
ncbi:MAG: CocE/NonD family hydrolase [Gemmatimonadetes bacterium]|nr:CocE/NonD family hydrolase [Gemmatimonadota bacterium]